jgi:tRNA pseudouridine55 synthase
VAIADRNLTASGILLINKPRGMTSFGVISRLRRLTGIRRIGHTGTLDPFAEGLLVVCLGRSTAIVQFMERYDKSYRLGIVFGRATDTQDLTGQTTFAREMTADAADQMRQDDFAEFRQAVQALTGEHQQLPPMYSAVKVEGRPLYEYARRGQEIERKTRRIMVYRAAVEQITLDGELRAQLTISCSKGTYIRTLADDLGKKLGYGAHADSLTRLQCGPFSLDQAVGLEQLQLWRDEYPDSAAFLEFLSTNDLLLPIEKAFAGFPALNLTEQEAFRLMSGQLTEMQTADLAAQWPEHRQTDWPAGPIAIYCRCRLIAVAHLAEVVSDTVQLITERVLVDLADFR